MSDLGPTNADGYVPPSSEMYYDNPQWEASIELQIKTVNTKATIALACGIGGMGLGLLANFLAGKLVKSVQEISNVTQTLYQVESQRGTFGGAIVAGPGPTGQPIQDQGEQSWGAVRPDTSHIGRTTPVAGSETLDESRLPYQGTVATPQEGPSSAATEVVRGLIAHDAIRPADVAKGDGNVR